MSVWSKLRSNAPRARTVSAPAILALWKSSTATWGPKARMRMERDGSRGSLPSPPRRARMSSRAVSGASRSTMRARTGESARRADSNSRVRTGRHGTPTASPVFLIRVAHRRSAEWYSIIPSTLDLTRRPEERVWGSKFCGPSPRMWHSCKADQLADTSRPTPGL